MIYLSVLILRIIRLLITHLELNVQYSSSDYSPLFDPSLYHTVVDSLIYLSITRTDIAHTINIISKFVTSPTIVH